MKKIFNLLEFAMVGAGIGSIITTICISIMAGQVCRTKDFAVWITASAIIGMITRLMYSDKISLIIATIIHFCISFIVVLFAAYLCGYGTTFSELFKNILPVFLIVYFTVYILIFIVSKCNEKTVNAALNYKN